VAKGLIHLADGSFLITDFDNIDILISDDECCVMSKNDYYSISRETADALGLLFLKDDYKKYKKKSKKK
jgi:hypothetical protein